VLLLLPTSALASHPLPLPHEQLITPYRTLHNGLQVGREQEALGTVGHWHTAVFLVPLIPQPCS
jgi:hypothetical protein